MPRIIELNGIGLVQLYKRRGNRNIRLGFSSSGEVRVSLPAWASYEAGIRFAIEKQDWIIKHRPPATLKLKDGDRIGKAHTLRLQANSASKSPRVRVANNYIIVTFPSGENPENNSVQQAAERGGRQALKAEGEKLLPLKLKQLATDNGFNYNGVNIRHLKAKWGSCNHLKQITLNFYLMQLPWQLIDYVLLHELVHTEHLNHSLEFWQRFENIMPDAKKVRKQLRSYKTAVVSAPSLLED